MTDASARNDAPHRPSRGRRLTAVLGAVTAMVVLAACNPIFGDDAGPVNRYIMSRTIGDGYHYVETPTGLTVLAPAPLVDVNIREFFWDHTDPYVADQQTCMTWETTTSGGAGMVQQGLGMRIAPRADGTGLRAIAINQNIWAAATWIIYVNLWESTGADTRDGTDFTYSSAATFDVSPVVGKRWLDDDGVLQSSFIGAPWHVCARLHGSDVTFKIWTGTNPEPAWDDPVHVFSGTLPPGWDQRGYSGGYIGHLPENTTATFSGFSTIPLCLVPDTVECPEQPTEPEP